MNIDTPEGEKELQAWHERHRRCQACHRRHTIHTARGVALCQPCDESPYVQPIAWTRPGMTEAEIAAIQAAALEVTP